MPWMNARLGGPSLPKDNIERGSMGINYWYLRTTSAIRRRRCALPFAPPYEVLMNSDAKQAPKAALRVGKEGGGAGKYRATTNASEVATRRRFKDARIGGRAIRMNERDSFLPPPYEYSRSPRLRFQHHDSILINGHFDGGRPELTYAYDGDCADFAISGRARRTVRSHVRATESVEFGNFESYRRTQVDIAEAQDGAVRRVVRILERW